MFQWRSCWLIWSLGLIAHVCSLIFTYFDHTIMRLIRFHPLWNGNHTRGKSFRYTALSSRAKPLNMLKYMEVDLLHGFHPASRASFISFCFSSYYTVQSICTVRKGSACRVGCFKWTKKGWEWGCKKSEIEILVATLMENKQRNWQVVVKNHWAQNWRIVCLNGFTKDIVKYRASSLWKNQKLSIKI